MHWKRSMYLITHIHTQTHRYTHTCLHSYTNTLITRIHTNTRTHTWQSRLTRWHRSVPVTSLMMPSWAEGAWDSTIISYFFPEAAINQQAHRPIGLWYCCSDLEAGSAWDGGRWWESERSEGVSVSVNVRRWGGICHWRLGGEGEGRRRWWRCCWWWWWECLACQSGQSYDDQLEPTPNMMA